MSKKDWKKGRKTKPKTAIVKKPKKEKEPKIQAPTLCGDAHGTVCEKHGLPCNIPVAFDPNDTRSEWVEALRALGAPSHGPDDKHRCIKCEQEQIKDSPWRFLRVPGSAQNLPTSQDGEDIAAHLKEMGWKD